jgi:hypothetical protein
MLVRIAYIYVGLLFACVVAVLSVSLIAHILILSRLAYLPITSNTAVVFSGVFLIAFPAFGFAKDRNVWKYEFLNCPMWLRIAGIVFPIYCLLCGLGFAAMRTENGLPLVSEELFNTTVPLFCLSGPVWILYALLWGKPVSDSELLKRCGISLIGLTAITAFVVWGVLHHR